MLWFFAELGFSFAFIAHSRGWPAKDVENNIIDVENISDFKDGAKDLVRRCKEMAEILIVTDLFKRRVVLSGRKARKIELSEKE